MGVVISALGYAAVFSSFQIAQYAFYRSPIGVCQIFQKPCEVPCNIGAMSGRVESATQRRQPIGPSQSNLELSCLVSWLASSCVDMGVGACLAFCIPNLSNTWSMQAGWLIVIAFLSRATFQPSIWVTGPTVRFKITGTVQTSSLSSDGISFSARQVLVADRSEANGLYQVSSLRTEKEIQNSSR